VAETSGVTGGEAEWRLALPGKLNVKIGPPLSLHFGFSIRLVFIRLCFCVFRSIFRLLRVLPYPSISGFTIISQIFF